MPRKFQAGRRYRVTILPAGARTRTVTFEGNYLGRGIYPGDHEFDCRPESGTQQIRADGIRAVQDLGPAVHSRR